MNSDRHDIVVIGSSAGGFEALATLVRELPENIPAALFIVNHMAPGTTGKGLISYLKKFTSLQCKLADHDEAIAKSTIYVAPPDFHTLITKERIMVVRGPRENKYRPAIDPLFRSAAVAFGGRVIGIILSGMLEDGTAGMHAIKRCGGIAITQDPEEALFPDMPTIVERWVTDDYSLPTLEIGKKLPYLVEEPASNGAEVPEDLILENDVALRFLTGNQIVEKLGELSPFSCPDCGGSLWQRNNIGGLQFRCHSGHSYDAFNLLQRKSEGLEESMWISLRLLEEKKNILSLMAQKYTNDKSHPSFQNLQERIEESNMHIERIREFLFYHKKNS